MIDGIAKVDPMCFLCGPSSHGILDRWGGGGGGGVSLYVSCHF